MIVKLRGTVWEKLPARVVLDVGGVGYEIFVPMSTFCDLPHEGESVVLLTVHLIREDAQQLYGFLTEQERGAFVELIKITGVGPKMAQALLSGVSVAQLAVAVEQQEVGLLQRVPGIGKKTAQRLVLELKGKLNVAEAQLALGGPPAQQDVLDALTALGYSDKEVASVVRDLDSSLSTPEQIKLALRRLTRVS